MSHSTRNPATGFPWGFGPRTNQSDVDRGASDLRPSGWWEEYRCGCVSELVPRKRDLLGYCGTHGDDPTRRSPHRHYK